MDNSNNKNKTLDLQIDEVVKGLKALLMPQANSPEQAEEIRCRLDSIGHEVKALNAFVNERNIPKAMVHKILSRMQQYI